MLPKKQKRLEGRFDTSSPFMVTEREGVGVAAAPNVISVLPTPGSGVKPYHVSVKLSLLPQNIVYKVRQYIII